MKKKEFLKLVKEEGFGPAMRVLNETAYGLTDYETLKSYVINEIEEDNNMLALHIWNAVYNSEGDSEWYYYDYTAGTTCTPVCLNTVEDVETYIGFD